jgi:hypothetical protein
VNNISTEVLVYGKSLLEVSALLGYDITSLDNWIPLFLRSGTVTWHHVPEEMKPQLHCFENLKTQK